MSLPPLQQLDPLAKHLENLIVARKRPRDAVTEALNGGAYSWVRRTVSTDLRRGLGMFFTAHTTADALASKLTSATRAKSPVLDPACGGGDLLIAVARQLPMCSSFSDTLKLWGASLYGFDVVPELIRIAKLRLLLLLCDRGNFRLDEMPTEDELFENILTGDFLKNTLNLDAITAVVVNPPYSLVTPRLSATWGRGKLSSAALFLDKIDLSCPNAKHVAALLPEVLRCGVRYERWRQGFTRRFKYVHVAACGQFDKWTDVDVFAAILCRREAPPRVSTPKKRLQLRTIENAFDVSVGTVVPFREKNRGPWVPFADVRSVPRHVMIRDSELGHRRYKGKLFTPPFVVVRRTSRPTDAVRAVASIITGTKSVAVENHMIVLKPKRGSIPQCQKLSMYLATKEVKLSLDQTMRCRHLTVRAVRALPWS